MGLNVYDQGVVTSSKASSDYLPITIRAMSWLMAFIQGRWGLDHFQKVFESRHRTLLLYIGVSNTGEV